jgi:putative hydrolase of the HAD superfamily
MLLLLQGEIRPAVVEAIRRCRDAGLVTACLTNNFVTGDRTPADGAPGHAEVLELFAFVLESSKAGVRKPDPAFYEMACAMAGVDPTEVVFLDDLGVNLKPAKAMGMTTIKVGDPAIAIAELADVVGFPLA